MAGRTAFFFVQCVCKDDVLSDAPACVCKDSVLSDAPACVFVRTVFWQMRLPVRIHKNGE